VYTWGCRKSGPVRLGREDNMEIFGMTRWAAPGAFFVHGSSVASYR
jgi:hypothetical protein